jgi:hypothetical protein
MANKQTTAVEWLVKFLTDRGYIVAPSFGHSIIDEGIKQALAMQREQTIRFAYEQIRNVESETGDLTYRKVPEELYTETYGKE